MKKFSNERDIPTLAAVWLSLDNYDYNDDPRVISTTSLLKSTRQIILGSRNQGEASVEDISSRVAATMGTALHDSIEAAWKSPELANTLMSLGASEAYANSVSVNPESPTNGIDTYFELRSHKEICGRVVSGKFDAILNGTIQDIKSTGTFTFTKKTNDDKYIKQLSIYRWLNPTLVTNNVGKIIYIFKDWSSNKALSASPDKYPHAPIMEYEFNLLSLNETEAFIIKKLTEIDKFKDADDSDLPLCTEEDLWRDAPEYKYYAKPDAKRATKNFGNDPAAAYAFMRSKGGIGMVIEIPSEPKACLWCSAPKCSQRDVFIANGSLKV